MTLSGTAPEGNTLFAMWVTSTVDGPPLVPISSLWWMDIDGPFALQPTISGTDEDGVAALEIRSIDGTQTDVPFASYGSAGHCAPFGWDATIDDPTTLGVPPYTVTLRLNDGARSYEIVWKWPCDLDDDTLTGAMLPAD